MAVTVSSVSRCLLLVCIMSVSASTVAAAGHSTCMAILSEFAWWILVILRLMIIGFRLISLEMAVAVYSVFNYFLLFCTMLIFASTVTLAGHWTRSATSTALCRVMEATSLLPDGKMIATSIRCRVRSIALLLVGPNYIAVRSYWYSCWSRLV